MNVVAIILQKNINKYNLKRKQYFLAPRFFIALKRQEKQQQNRNF